MNSEPKKRILIGFPAFNGIVAECQESVMRMIFRCGRDMPDYDIAVMIVTKAQQYRARNRIVEAAIAGGFEYVLMLDDDMVIPHDLLPRLLAHEKDVVGALYYQRGGAYHPVIMKRHSYDNGDFRAQFLSPYDPILQHGGLHRVDIIGGGCMLFRTDVFRKLLPPYFWSEEGVGTDIAICGRLQDVGIEIWVDTTIELGHIGNRQIVTSRTVPLATREMGLINEQLYTDLIEYLCLIPEQFDEMMMRSESKEYRKQKWVDKPRETWKDIADYYTDDKEWHLANLAYWNLHGRSQQKEWAISLSDTLMPIGSTVLDYGAGLGHLSIPLAQRKKCYVYALDISGSPTQEFIEWRIKKHGLEPGGSNHYWAQTMPIDGAMPYVGMPRQLDGVFMISVIEHLTKPYEVVEWLTKHVKPGGFFVCDYLHSTHIDEDEPQHLNRYDYATFDDWMHKIGWETSPEYPWLFLRKG